MNKFDERFLKILSQTYFEENESSWGKESLLSAVILGDIFNSYIDFAEQTDNFTNFSEEISSDQPFKTALIKNLLFIYSILDKVGLDEIALYEALKTDRGNYFNNHPSYSEFKESLLNND
jgi:hypothetical protein